MKSNFKTIWTAVMLMLLGAFAKAQTPPTISGTVAVNSQSCSGLGSLSVNLTAGATPYNLVNSDLSSLPLGALVGGVNWTPTFTSGNPHYLQLTPPNNDKKGFISFATTALKPVAFTANFGLYVGNGNGADGTSFNYGKVNTSSGNYGEFGMIDSGLAIGFNDYSNKIIIYYNQVQLTTYNVSGTLNNSNWKSVSISVNTSGQLTIAHGGTTYCTNYQLPAAYLTDNKNNWQYGFAARCGGLNNLHAVNDVVIKDYTPMQYSVDGTNYFTNNSFSLAPGTYTAYARIGDNAYNANYNTIVNLGAHTIASGITAAPNISYTTPVTYTVGTSISPLTPTNTGGNPVGVLNNVSTLAGSGSVGSTDGTGNAASFNGPQQLALDSSGNIYVADQFNNKIRKITPAGVVSTLTTGTTFNAPAGIAIDNIGNLYVSDTYNNRIVKIATSGLVSTLAGSGSVGNSDGYGSAASFKWPNQLTVDKHNNIYLADAGNNSVRKITPAGLVTTVASIPLAPEALIVDDAGNVYVVNNGNNVYKITSGGVVSIFAGSSAPGSVDASGTAASFNSPYGINLDTYGNLYVGDFGNNKIRKITPNGVVTTFAGGSTSSSVDGSLTNAGFSGPTGIAFDAQGKMYVADYNGNKIRIINGPAYTITPALPTGLSMDATTGVISGTPTVASVATNYTVTANNCGGTNNAIVNITVVSVCTPTTSSNNVTIYSNQLPYNWNGLTFNAAGTQTAHLTNAAGCDSAATLTLNVIAASAQLNLKLYLQGLYLGNGAMIAAPFSADGISPSTIADTITIELHDTTSSHTLIATNKSSVSTSGMVSSSFSGTLMGNAYFVVIKHRNSITTWSANPIVLGQTNNYDFSNAASKAFGSNMADDGNGVFIMYTGDINQDGSVDFNDYPDLDISSNNGDLGYYVTDLNGDASVDFSDYPLLDINSNLGTLTMTP